jgi:hypothetical protein
VGVVIQDTYRLGFPFADGGIPDIDRSGFFFAVRVTPIPDTDRPVSPFAEGMIPETDSPGFLCRDGDDQKQTGKDLPSRRG